MHEHKGDEIVIIVRQTIQKVYQVPKDILERIVQL